MSTTPNTSAQYMPLPQHVATSGIRRHQWQVALREVCIRQSCYMKALYLTYMLGFGTIDHYAHRKRRAANSPLFATKSVADATSQIQLRANKLCSNLVESCKESVPVIFSLETLSFTTDLMTDIILGQPLGCQADKTVAESWFATTNSLPRITPLVKQFPWIVAIALKVPLWVIRVILPDIALLVLLHRQMIRESQQHAQRRTEGEIQDNTSQRHLNLFKVLDDSDLPLEEKDVHRQAHEAFVLVSAGTVSTARTIASCIFQLVHSPETFSRLRKELETVMPEPDSEPGLKTLENLPYLVSVEGL
jgi:cytochrome P450